MRYIYYSMFLVFRMRFTFQGPETIGGWESIVLLRWYVFTPSRNQSHGSSDCPAATPHHLILHAIIITDAKSIESYCTHLRHPRISPVFACYSWLLFWYSHQLTRSRHNSRAFSKHAIWLRDISNTPRCQSWVPNENTLCSKVILSSISEI